MLTWANSLMANSITRSNIFLNGNRSAFKRKISEALFTKQLKPSLNVKEQSIQLHLYK